MQKSSLSLSLSHRLCVQALTKSKYFLLIKSFQQFKITNHIYVLMYNCFIIRIS